MPMRPNGAHLFGYGFPTRCFSDSHAGELEETMAMLAFFGRSPWCCDSSHALQRKSKLELARGDVIFAPHLREW